MTPRPEWLRPQCTLLDYQIGLQSRDRWLPLGEHFCPGFLTQDHRMAVCEVYGLDLNKQVVDLPAEIQHMNEHYFCTRFSGRSTGHHIWTIDTLGPFDLPVLWRVTADAIVNIYDGMLAPDGKTALADWWWAHPGKREYERIIIAPRETA